MVGYIELSTGTGANSVTAEVPEEEEEAALVARTVTLLAARSGAVYSPAEVMRPTVSSPPAIPFTDQLTAVFELPVTVAVNCCESPPWTLALLGETLTLTEG
jgi:hypothetical protein